MNRSPFSGRDCVEVESDPTADPFDRLLEIRDIRGILLTFPSVKNYFKFQYGCICAVYLFVM